MTLCKDYFDHLIPQNRFNYAINVILEHEGLLSDGAHDSGGLTKYGISLRYLKDEKIDINKDGDSDKDDIRALSKQEAIAIYKKDWWDKYNYEAINDVKVATKIFDMAVNMGPIEAHKLTQQALNHLLMSKLQVDGVLGAKTIASINAQHEGDMLQELREEQKDFYLRLITNKPALKIYEKGWLARAAW